MGSAAVRQTLLGAWQRRGPLAWMLWPLSLLYRGLWLLRQALYQHGFLTTQRVPVPVIVVGNVVAGGGGKTPLVIALVQHLQSLGLRPGVVSRGYGRSTHGCLAVTGDSDAAAVGDEPLLIHRRTGAPVQVAAKRIDAARALLARDAELDLLVCDDGLQHLALHRDIEICVFDERGTGNGFLLPAGPLREPWPRQTDLVLRSGHLPTGPGYSVRRVLADHGLRADGSQVALDHLQPQAQSRPVTALAGIARPESFFTMLRERGVVLDHTLALPDHAPPDPQTWSVPADHLLLCTEKDAVKWWPLRPDALAVPLVISVDPGFWSALTRLLQQHGPAPRPAKLSSRHGHTPS